MPNKTLTLFMAIFVGLTTVASSFAALIPNEPKGEPAKLPEPKAQPIKQAEEKTEPAKEPTTVQREQQVAQSRPVQVSKPEVEQKRPYRRVELSWRDIQLLAHMVQGEARGEPFIGKVAVASVVINRLQRPNFPNTVAGIIYGAGEFCTVRDGQINLPPNSEAYRAVELALRGWDPSYGAIYFYNPARSSSRWIFTRPILVKYGQHVFAG
jgi:spore germination cell wall hydrolase CwlJ-like protein